MPRGLGPTQKKILTLLAAGFSLSFAYSPHQRRRVWQLADKEFQKIDREALQRSISGLYESKLVEYKESGDGLVTIIINNAGKKKALTYEVDEMKIGVPKKWDKKWRLVIFDIPTYLKRARETLRAHLKYLGLYRLQKSIFVFPYECKDEIDFLVELYDLRPFVRYIVAESIDNELHLKQIFKHILK